MQSLISHRMVLIENTETDNHELGEMNCHRTSIGRCAKTDGNGAPNPSVTLEGFDGLQTLRDHANEDAEVSWAGQTECDGLADADADLPGASTSAVSVTAYTRLRAGGVKGLTSWQFCRANP